MTKSTITRERLEALANAEYCKSNPGAWLLGLKELNELARMALAAMDSEPVAIVEPSDYVTAAQLVGEESIRKAVRELYEGALRIGDKLYRHAQPAPVSMKDHQIRELVNELRDIAIEYHGTQQLRERIARTVRDAMLNGGKS